MIYEFKHLTDYLRLCPALMRHGDFSFSSKGELFRSGQAITDATELSLQIRQICGCRSYPRLNPFRMMEICEKRLCRQQQGGPK